MTGCKSTRRRIAALAALALPALFWAEAGAAQIFLHEPDFRRGPIEASDPLIGIPIPGATPAEYRAHMLWNLRAGLNVAALQCQFSPYLRAVPNYNAVLAHHSGELASAYTALTGYFTRTLGAREGTRRFDDYSTMTYNNFSTLQAQLGFCQTASNIAKEALARPKGELHLLAAARMRELRNSLVVAHDRIGTGANPYAINLGPLPVIPPAPDCTRLRGRAKRACEVS
jgi:hypothetical protein